MTGIVRQHATRRLSAIALLLAALAAGSLANAIGRHGTAGPTDEKQIGQDIFEGRLPVAARMPGHSHNLPGYAVRCANCHQDRPRGTTGNASKPLGPLLDSTWLTNTKPRRGGPPSRYQAPSFCELLRTGVDPGGVMIDPTMPRFDLTDAQCNALWHHLTQTAAGDAAQPRLAQP